MLNRMHSESFILDNPLAQAKIDEALADVSSVKVYDIFSNHKTSLKNLA